MPNVPLGWLLVEEFYRVKRQFRPSSILSSLARVIELLYGFMGIWVRGRAQIGAARPWVEAWRCGM